MRETVVRIGCEVMIHCWECSGVSELYAAESASVKQVDSIMSLNHNNYGVEFKPRQDLTLTMAIRSIITHVPPLYAMSVLINKIVNAIDSIGETYVSDYASNIGGRLGEPRSLGPSKEVCLLI